MPVAPDSNTSFASYSDPRRLVSSEWLSAHLGHPEVKVVESDEDVLLYDVGHIPGAVKVDWHLDLNDPVTRDYIDGAAFAALMDRKGIRRTDTVVIYGDKSNWWAAYALWVFTLFGHEDVRLLDGGRDAWISENRDTTLDIPGTTTSGYPVVERNDAPIRASRTTSSTTSGRARWWMSGRRRSTPVNAPTCPTTRRKARCAAATSPLRCRFRGRRPPPRTAASVRVRNSTRSMRISARTTTSSHTAASVSGRATPGSC